MRVADLVAEWLDRKGVKHAFGIVGGGNLALWDAITRREKTQIVCVHHEQAAAMAAAYFYRTSGSVALALVTTGGGSSNAITGVLAAHMDRVPVLVISGNESSRYLETQKRVWGTQGFDSSGVASYFTKQAERVAGENGVIEALDSAFDYMLKPPFGPVWLDIPSDLQRELV